MPENLAGFPFEFAQGVLSLRSTLAQQDAHLQQIKAQARIQAELEAERNRIAEQGQALQYAGHHEAIQAQGQRQAAEISSNEKIAEMRLKEIQEQKQLDRESRTANITSKIGKEPVFVPSWMKLPADIPVPEITDEHGQKKPAYTIGRLADPNGQGEFVFPINNAENQAKYDNLKSQIQLHTENAALKQLQGQLVTARRNSIEGLKTVLGYSPTGVVENLQKEWQKVESNGEKLIAQKQLQNVNDPEISKMQADPLYRFEKNPKLHAEMQHLSDINEAIRQRVAESMGAAPGVGSGKSTDPAYVAAQQDVLGKAPPAVTAPPAPFLGAVARIEEHGLVSKEGAFQAERSRGGVRAQKMLEALGNRQGIGIGRRVTYYGEKGNELGQEIYSDGGQLIKQTGTIPPGGKVGNNGAPVQATPAGGVTQAPPGVPAAPINAGVDRRRLKELVEKNSLTPEEAQEFDRLMKAAGQ